MAQSSTIDRLPAHLLSAGVREEIKSEVSKWGWFILSRDRSDVTKAVESNVGKVLCELGMTPMLAGNPECESKMSEIEATHIFKHPQIRREAWQTESRGACQQVSHLRLWHEAELRFSGAPCLITEADQVFSMSANLDIWAILYWLIIDKGLQNTELLHLTWDNATSSKRSQVYSWREVYRKGKFTAVGVPQGAQWVSQGLKVYILTQFGRRLLLSQETFPMRALDVYATQFLADNLEPFAVKMVKHPLCESDYNPLDIHRSSGRVARDAFVASNPFFVLNVDENVPFSSRALYLAMAYMVAELKGLGLLVHWAYSRQICPVTFNDAFQTPRHLPWFGVRKKMSAGMECVYKELPHCQSQGSLSCFELATGFAGVQAETTSLMNHGYLEPQQHLIDTLTHWRSNVSGETNLLVVLMREDSSQGRSVLVLLSDVRISGPTSIVLHTVRNNVVPWSHRQLFQKLTALLPDINVSEERTTSISSLVEKVILYPSNIWEREKQFSTRVLEEMMLFTCMRHADATVWDETLAEDSVIRRLQWSTWLSVWDETLAEPQGAKRYRRSTDTFDNIWNSSDRLLHDIPGELSAFFLRMRSCDHDELEIILYETLETHSSERGVNMGEVGRRVLAHADLGPVRAQHEPIRKECNGPKFLKSIVTSVWPAYYPDKASKWKWREPNELHFAADLSEEAEASTL